MIENKKNRVTKFCSTAELNSVGNMDKNHVIIIVPTYVLEVSLIYLFFNLD